jgi:xylan 1,4-beta-xylosidase
VRGPLFLLGLLACLVPPLIGAIAHPAQHRAQPAQHPVALRVPSSITATDAGGRPAFDKDFPDPSVIADGRLYYAFSTHTAWEPSGHVFPILESSDLASWRYSGDVFSAPPAWGRGDWWAPAVVARSGSYFLYYSGLDQSGMHCLAVATATTAAGPYVDHGPIACSDGTQAAGYIDAWPLVAGGRAYLYFSVDGPQHHSISVLPLSADMLSVAGPRVELLGVSEDWEAVGNATVEGPSIFAWGSGFVMLYSGGDWRGQYGMGYALATSPTGPFLKSSSALLRSGGALIGPGGGSFFTDSKGQPWLAYHAWMHSGRELYLSPLSITLR